jgi:plastocyanin
MSTSTRTQALLRTAVLTLVTVAGPSALAQTTHVITTSGFSFSPNNITIREGDTVRWTNLQGGSHNVAQTNCPETASSLYNGGFYSGFGGAVNTFEVTFDDAGEICFVCEPHVAFAMIGHITVEKFWSDLGGGTSGINGPPTLTADGPLTAGSPLTIDLVDAAPSTPILLWLSLAPMPIDALGGTVYAFPQAVQFIRTSSAAGSFSQGLAWPAGIPGGIGLTLQFLILDLSVPQEIVLSNAVLATTP